MTYDDREDTEPYEVMHPENICPKCGREFIDKNYFGTPDKSGVIAVVWHDVEKIKDLFDTEHEQTTNGCFLTQEEWDSLEEPKYISTFNPKRPIAEIVLEQGFHSKGSLILKQKKLKR